MSTALQQTLYQAEFWAAEFYTLGRMLALSTITDEQRADLKQRLADAKSHVDTLNAEIMEHLG